MVKLNALLLLIGVCVSPSTTPASASPAACHSELRRGVLPVWARGGFSRGNRPDPAPRLPHVVGRSNEIAALMFRYPLVAAPPSAGPTNKVLWVSRRTVIPLSDLRISAQRMVGARGVGPIVKRVIVGGPGPSSTDLPAVGCWRLTLRWSGRTDHLDLHYSAARHP